MGYENSFDAYHVTAPKSDKVGTGIAILNEINYSNIIPDPIDYINSDCTNTQLKDKAESTAKKYSFKKHYLKPYVNSTKLYTSHLLRACNAIEVILTLLAIKIHIYCPQSTIKIKKKFVI